MSWTAPSNLRIPANADVLAFLDATVPSAHSDIASELDSAVRGLPGTSTVCPDPARYAWVLAHTAGGRIYAVAYGQSALCVRVGEAKVAEALVDRAVPAPQLGEGWVQFDPFDADEPTATLRARIHRWCTVAFQQAGGAGAKKSS